MRSEDRKHAIEVAKRILMFRLGLDDSLENLADLKVEWHAMLIPPPSRHRVDEMWNIVTTPVL